jgi:hypothetical protein
MTPTERLVAIVGVLMIVATLSATALARLLAAPVVIAVPTASDYIARPSWPASSVSELPTE